MGWVEVRTDSGNHPQSRIYIYIVILNWILLITQHSLADSHQLYDSSWFIHRSLEYIDIWRGKSNAVDYTIPATKRWS